MVNQSRLELQSVHNELFQQIAELHFKWKQWQELFENKRETVDLLNRTAPSFFGRYQRVLVDDIILSMARLLDPAKTGKNCNLSLDRLRECVDAIKDSKSTSDFDAAFTAFKQYSTSVEKYRHKVLAHNDLATIRGVESLPSITIRDITSGLAALQDAMNVVERYLNNNAETGYGIVSAPGGADALIFHLQQSLLAQEN